MSDRPDLKLVEENYQTPLPETLRRMWSMLRGRRFDVIWNTSSPFKLHRDPQKRDEYWRGKIGASLALLEEGIPVQSQHDLERAGQPHSLRWSFICTLFDAADREFGAPPRIHINTPWGHIAIAIGPHGKLQKPHGSRKSGWVRFYPQNYRLCRKIVGVDLDSDGKYIFGIYPCTLKAGHVAGCWNWKTQRHTYKVTFDREQPKTQE